MSAWLNFDPVQLDEFLVELLKRAGADQPSAASVSKSAIEASLRGVDTHGVILIPHYVRAITGGRINGRPKMTFSQIAPATGALDADNGFGHHASYEAVARAIELASKTGIAAVAVSNSSHFGAAASYTLEAARRGFAAFAFSHSDAVVVPFDGERPFNGTNPIAFAAPVRDRPPISVDIATSAIAWNRLVLLKEANKTLPDDVVVDDSGRDTAIYDKARALLPLGVRAHGHKGAALASIVEVLSSAFTGMVHGNKLIRMDSADLGTPRRLGHFFIVLAPEAFVPRAVYDHIISDYLADLRSQSTDQGRVLAPGDKEQETAIFRSAAGLPILDTTLAELTRLAEELAIDVPRALSSIQRASDGGGLP
ncbi:MAG TPA: Ldh family oxidoreductase [Nordella sp.]|nr:Ldh family oxidoreductase [Nordella sp.]